MYVAKSKSIYIKLKRMAILLVIDERLCNLNILIFIYLLCATDNLIFLDSGRLGMLVGMRNVQGCEMRELTSSDDEGWQEREASRTHSVKFTDEPPEADKEVSVYLFLSFYMLLCNTLFDLFLFLIISTNRLHLYVKTHHIQKS